MNNQIKLGSKLSFPSPPAPPHRCSGGAGAAVVALRRQGGAAAAGGAQADLEPDRAGEGNLSHGGLKGVVAASGCATAESEPACGEDAAMPACGFGNLV